MTPEAEIELAETLVNIADGLAWLKGNLEVAIKRIDLLERQFDTLQDQHTEIITEKLMKGLYSEGVLRAKMDFDTKGSQVDALGKAILDMALMLPDEQRDDIRKRVFTAIKPPQLGGVPL